MPCTSPSTSMSWSIPSRSTSKPSMFSYIMISSALTSLSTLSLPPLGSWVSMKGMKPGALPSGCGPLLIAMILWSILPLVSNRDGPTGGCTFVGGIVTVSLSASNDGSILTCMRALFGNDFSALRWRCGGSRPSHDIGASAAASYAVRIRRSLCDRIAFHPGGLVPTRLWPANANGVCCVEHRRRAAEFATQYTPLALAGPSERGLQCPALRSH